MATYRLNNQLEIENINLLNKEFESDDETRYQTQPASGMTTARVPQRKSKLVGQLFQGSLTPEQLVYKSGQKSHEASAFNSRMNTFDEHSDVQMTEAASENLYVA